jgi:hypothetical protein
MLRAKAIFVAVIGLAVLGLIFVNARSGDVWAAVAPTASVPMKDGLPAEDVIYVEPAQPSAVGGPTYTRTYAGIEFHAAPSDLPFKNTGFGIYATSIPAGGFSFKLPLDLPNGAQVTKVTAYVVDNDPTANITIGITRTNPSSISFDTLASFSTTNANTSASIQEISITGSPIFTVDNATYAYFLRDQPAITGQNHILYGARLEYGFSAVFLPMVTK